MKIWDDLESLYTLALNTNVREIKLDFADVCESGLYILTSCMSRRGFVTTVWTLIKRQSTVGDVYSKNIDDMTCPNI